MTRKLRLLYALLISLAAWMPMLGVLSSSHYYVNNIEVPPPAAVVMSLTMLATAVTVLTLVWLVQSPPAEKQKRKRSQSQTEIIEAARQEMLSDGEIADAWERLADSADSSAAGTAAFIPDDHIEKAVRLN